MSNKDFSQEPLRVEELEAQLQEAEEIIEELDVEASSKFNCKPKARVYRIRIDKHYFKVHHSVVTGREILTVAGKVPPKNFLLFQIDCNGKSDEIALDESVDLSKPGIEKFRTLPRDQTEG